MHDKIKAFLAALAVSALGVVGLTATPALAAGPCSSDSLCFYDTSSSSSPMIDHDDADTSPGECHVMPSAHRYKASYVKNQTDHQWHWFTHTNCQGGGGPLYAKTNGSIASNQAVAYRRVG